MNTDWQLVQHTVAGDQRAFELLVLKYQRRIERFRYARRKLDDSHAKRIVEMRQRGMTFPAIARWFTNNVTPINPNGAVKNTIATREKLRSCTISKVSTTTINSGTPALTEF